MKNIISLLSLMLILSVCLPSSHVYGNEEYKAPEPGYTLGHYRLNGKVKRLFETRYNTRDEQGERSKFGEPVGFGEIIFSADGKIEKKLEYDPVKKIITRSVYNYDKTGKYLGYTVFSADDRMIEKYTVKSSNKNKTVFKGWWEHFGTDGKKTVEGPAFKLYVDGLLINAFESLPNGRIVRDWKFNYDARDGTRYYSWYNAHIKKLLSGTANHKLDEKKNWVQETRSLPHALRTPEVFILVERTIEYY